MKTLTKVALASVVAVTTLQQTFATISVGLSNVSNSIQGNNNTADNAVQGIIQTLLTYLGLVAVCYALYGGFLMLTSGESDDKVKKGKTVLFNAALGILVIFLAYSIVGLIFHVVGGQ